MLHKTSESISSFSLSLPLLHLYYWRPKALAFHCYFMFSYYYFKSVKSKSLIALFWKLLTHTSANHLWWFRDTIQCSTILYFLYSTAWEKNILIKSQNCCVLKGTNIIYGVEDNAMFVTCRCELAWVTIWIHFLARSAGNNQEAHISSSREKLIQKA